MNAVAAGWFDRSIVLPGKLPLAILLVMFVSTFVFIRISVRMIRAGVSWWPGNITPGGKHIHHMVFGVVFMIAAGFGAFSPIGDLHPWLEIFAGLFGAGAALVLDEFALILDLKDVYWSEQGRVSVDAVVVGASVCGLMLLGATPLGITDVFTGWQYLVAVVLINGALAIVTMTKGKLWTGMAALFVPTLGIVGAIRLARPQSPWARWRYAPASNKAIRAARRDQRERWIDKFRAQVYNAIAGRPSN